jgi:hypothetical protein
MRRLLGIVVMVCVSGAALAGNGVDPATVSLRDWDGGRPRVQVVVSGRFGTLLPLFVRTYNVSWKDGQGTEHERMHARFCDLINRNWADSCTTADSPRIRVLERYLGAPGGLAVNPIGTATQVGMDSLSGVGAGGSKVLYLEVWRNRTEKRELVAIAFDDGLSDEDLRDVAYEDGVLRMLGFRE